MTPLRKQAYELSGYILSILDRAEQSCSDLLLEWTKEFLWGQLVKRQIYQFRELYDYCWKNGHTSQGNAIWYGDDDVGVWIEKVRDHRQILVLRNVCTTRDDNTFVFIYDNIMLQYPEEFGDTCLEHFLSTNVWGRQKTRYTPAVFNDHRDIDRPSLLTLRRADFNFGYGDVRDEGHNFNYIGRNERVESAHWNENKIKQALIELKYAHNNIVVNQGG